MSFPITRMRRLREKEGLRRLSRESHLSIDQLIYPAFVQAGRDSTEPIPSMPGQYRQTVESVPRLAKQLESLGIPAVMLFGLPEEKDELGSGAFDPNGVIQTATKAIKDVAPDLVVIADTCLDEYTTHGHCGIVREGHVDNDATLEVLAQIAVSQSEAGVDMVAPSDMMDGRVAAIRSALDETGHTQLPIMAYSAKYASAFYGPFREAADCAPEFGDRRAYQMDTANRREALREVALDVEEGADVIMVKPGLAYLDVVREVRDAFDLPLATYNVSGEYAMVKAAAQNGWIDEQAVVLEILSGMVRAGANMVLTYYACEVAQWLRDSVDSARVTLPILEDAAREQPQPQLAHRH